MKRYTVKEAAQVLGVGTDAIRKRVQRNTITHERENGAVYVYLDTDEPRHDEDEPRHDTDEPRHDNGRSFAEQLLESHKEQLESYRDQVEFLRRELERKDAILLNMTEAMKALEAPREARDGDLTASEEPGGVRGHPVSQEPEQRRSWLYRFFFGP